MLGSRAVRLSLAVLVALVVIVRFGLAITSPALVTATDVCVAVTSLLFAAGVLLPGRGTTLKERILEERWLFLFTVLFVGTALVALFHGILSSGEGTVPDALRIVSLVYSSLCAVRVILAGFGSWALDQLSPAAILPVTFGVVIAVGSALLLLPAATPAGGNGLSPMDALFTSTSATCVTGLIVVDTSRDFTVFGQVVVLLLIQVGGLGIMTFAAFFALFLGHRAGLKESLSLSRIMDSDFVSDLKRILASIIGWTLAIECAGAFVLYLVWDSEPTGWTTGHTIWQSVFHSISAFCNAGFSLDPSVQAASVTAGSSAAGAVSNLEGFAHVPGIPLTIGALIVLGGLGFLVLTAVGASMLHRLRTGMRRKLPLNAKLVLLITCALIVLAFAVFLGMEWNGALAGMTVPQKFANAFLGAVTPRTAGFNTVPTSGLLPAVKWLFVALMFVGASPGGTGGGVKTTTMGLIFLGFLSQVRGKSSTELWKRWIPSHDLKRAAAVLLLGGLVFTLSAGILLAVETGPPGDPYGEPFDYVFESMSAFGTVGLSTGVTPHLTAAGKVVIVLTMFLGRIGPATLAAATGRTVARRYRYPEARVNIG